MNKAVIKEEVIEEARNFTFKNDENIRVKQEKVEQKPKNLRRNRIKTEPIDFFRQNSSSDDEVKKFNRYQSLAAWRKRQAQKKETMLKNIQNARKARLENKKKEQKEDSEGLDLAPRTSVRAPSIKKRQIHSRQAKTYKSLKE
ncbi:hypothetical protein B9Z55_014902 [Caenorhabditis nigoni]|uniref:Uncharacterized protein n=1 Tax=Caenorhabditis nigoni TaxID=1611254 RepID=A0A2G5U7S5_9PELO|nr:hypothetical protein B9Z55_014902 [Caenorhabditis nigoni]